MLEALFCGIFNIFIFDSTYRFGSIPLESVVGFEMDKKLLLLLKKKRKSAYANSDSILKEYDECLENNGIYHSLNIDKFKMSIKGHIELCDEILKLYYKANLENERIVLLEDLSVIGYDKNRLTELVLSVFYAEKRPTNLWEYADLLYSMKNYRYLPQYLDIIKDKSYGEDRQMLILLVGKSKNKDVIQVLTELLDDSTVYGHALEALSNFKQDEIASIMSRYKDCHVKWIQKIAKKYLSNINQEYN